MIILQIDFSRAKEKPKEKKMKVLHYCALLVENVSFFFYLMTSRGFTFLISTQKQQFALIGKLLFNTRNTFTFFLSNAPVTDAVSLPVAPQSPHQMRQIHYQGFHPQPIQKPAHHHQIQPPL